MSDALTSLTQVELLALALDASRRNDTGHSLAYLKEASGRADATPQGLFMLGSEYAQLGLATEAKEYMARAAQVGPDFPLASFQLGMLHLTSGEVEAAKSAWAQLAELDDLHPQAYLGTFRRGMLHLIADEFDAAVLVLREGIAQNQDNPPLNGDMSKVVDAIEHLPGRENTSAPAAEATPATPATAVVAPKPNDTPSNEEEVEPGHLFISAYTHGGKPH